MKILHTSDWHLGRSLYGRKRYEEFSAFLQWLVQTIEDEKVDALLIAGDVFDSSTPGNHAQELYYNFLDKVAGSCCRHVVVIAGNHDSPSFLNASRQLLRSFNVYVVGSISDVLEDEVFILHDKDKPKAIVCGVPYLRDKDVRIVEAGETIDDKNLKLVEGLKKHYANVLSIAEEKQAKLRNIVNYEIPIIVMGHLFTAGGKTIDGDGVRELYVGSLIHLEKEIFPPSIDYLALGHLHVPQLVGGNEYMRYCGSPIPMGFGEANQQKEVVIIDFIDKRPTIKTISVPCFQELVRLKGSLDTILSGIEELKRKKSLAWLEIEYSGKEVVPNLREVFNEAVKNSGMEILRIKNKFVMDGFINMASKEETLEELDPEDVFERCMEFFEIHDKERQELMGAYKEILKDVLEYDSNFE